MRQDDADAHHCKESQGTSGASPQSGPCDQRSESLDFPERNLAEVIRSNQYNQDGHGKRQVYLAPRSQMTNDDQTNVGGRVFFLQTTALIRFGF